MGEYAEAQGGRLDADEASAIFAQILDGLAYAHERGTVHSNLKLTLPVGPFSFPAESSQSSNSASSGCRSTIVLIHCPRPVSRRRWK